MAPWNSRVRRGQISLTCRRMGATEPHQTGPPSRSERTVRERLAASRFIALAAMRLRPRPSPSARHWTSQPKI
eukprot:2711341-Pyramimonas_sp.AAC.1